LKKSFIPVSESFIPVSEVPIQQNLSLIGAHEFFYLLFVQWEEFHPPLPCITSFAASRVKEGQGISDYKSENDFTAANSLLSFFSSFFWAGGVEHGKF
jgi:hypothetical protein